MHFVPKIIIAVIAIFFVYNLLPYISFVRIFQFILANLSTISKIATVAITIVSLAAGVGSWFVAVRQLKEARDGAKEQQFFLEKQQKTLDASRISLEQMVKQSEKQRLESQETFQQMLSEAKNQAQLLNETVLLAKKNLNMSQSQFEDYLIEKSKKPILEILVSVQKIKEGKPDERGIYPPYSYITLPEKSFMKSSLPTYTISINETGFFVRELNNDETNQVSEIWGNPNRYTLAKIPRNFLARRLNHDSTSLQILGRTDRRYFNVLLGTINTGSAIAEYVKLQFKAKSNTEVNGGVGKQTLNIHRTTFDRLNASIPVDFQQDFRGTIEIEVNLSAEKVKSVKKFIRIEIIE